MPAVWIVVPTFRRPHFLREALRDAVSQTWTDLEILVCDNGADQETERVVDECADPRIRYLPRPSNLGMKRNAVLGFAQAHGDFVLKLDDDDRLARTAVHKLIAPMLARPDVAMTFARLDLLNVDGRRLPAATRARDARSGGDHLKPGLHAPAEALVVRGTVDLACAMIRRDSVDWDDVPDEVATAYDRHIALQAVRDARPAWFVPERLAGYRVHPGNDSAQASLRQVLGSLYATELALNSGRHVDVDALREQSVQGAIGAGRLLLREARTREARAVLWTRLMRTPHGRSADLARLALLSCLPSRLAQRISLSRHDAYQQSAHPPLAPAEHWATDGDSAPLGPSGQDVERTA